MSFWKCLQNLLQTRHGKLLAAFFVLIAFCITFAFGSYLLRWLERFTIFGYANTFVTNVTFFIIAAGTISGFLASIYVTLRKIGLLTIDLSKITLANKWAITILFLVVSYIYSLWLIEQASGFLSLTKSVDSSSQKLSDNLQGIGNRIDDLTYRLEATMKGNRENTLPLAQKSTTPESVVSADFAKKIDKDIQYRVLTGKPETFEKAGTYNYYIIELQQNSTLTIPAGTTLRCNYLKAEKGATINVSTSGQTNPQKITLIANNAWGINDLRITANGADASSQTGTGSEGGKGRDAVFGPWGRSSENGKPGGDGKPGTNGGNAPSIEIIVGYVIDESNTEPKLPLVIESQGGKGGTGQKGGKGGRGGGADGDRTAAAGGTGGKGGNGGNGGNATNVIVQYIVLDNDGKEIEITNLVQGNSQLLPGPRGNGGAGGDGGQRGSGGIIKLGGDTGKTGQAGQPGSPGSPGSFTVTKINRETLESKFK